MKEAAGWLSERLEHEQDRFFRLGPAPLAPRAERRIAPQQPEALVLAMRTLATEPPDVSLAHMGLRFPPVVQFVERFRSLLRRRRRFDFEQEVPASRVSSRRSRSSRSSSCARAARSRSSRRRRLRRFGLRVQEGTTQPAEEGDSSWNARSA